VRTPENLVIAVALAIAADLDAKVQHALRKVPVAPAQRPVHEVKGHRQLAGSRRVAKIYALVTVIMVPVVIVGGPALHDNDLAIDAAAVTVFERGEGKG
jgi:hypothetical protein